jgi:hypothetical protein
MHDYLVQFLPDPMSVKIWAGILLTCVVAVLPPPTKPGVYKVFYDLANVLPIPTIAHLKK